MMFTELKTAAEVREHARMVQRRINQQRAIPAPPVMPPPMRHDEVPTPTPLAAPEDEEPDKSMLPLHASASPHPTRTVFVIAGDYFGFSIGEIIGDGRTQALVLPRQIGCFVAQRLGASCSGIGRAAQRDHTTVAYGCKTIAQRAREDDMIALAVDAIGSKAAEAFGANWRSVRKADR